MSQPILIATRGSALALAQANAVLGQCRAHFPDLNFELKIVKTTGDKLQTASMAQEGKSLPKGLFTKELELALLNGEADLAVHSLKDLPTELPSGLGLTAVGKREDVRDVLIYRDAGFAANAGKRSYGRGLSVSDLPTGAVVATSSTRRKAQLLIHNASLKVPDIRGNVGTRMQKLLDNPELDATVLALAGISRLHIQVQSDGRLVGTGIPEGLLASILDIRTMLPCVGQGAVGIETRLGDERITRICQPLNDPETLQCVLAERAFLAEMGGGCQSPVAAYAHVAGSRLVLRALSFVHGPVRHAEASRPEGEAEQLGKAVASELKA